MIHTVLFRPLADRQFRSLSREVQLSVRKTIDALSLNPRPAGVKKLRGAENLYRIKAGPGKAHRILYEIHDDRLLGLVVKIGHRKEVYRSV